MELTAALLGAVFGALASLIVAEFHPRWRRRRLTKTLQIVFVRQEGPSLNCRVINKGYWTVTNATLYISIENSSTDVLDPPVHFKAFVSRKNPVQVIEDRMCWSLAVDGKNPHQIEIFASESQAFTPFQILSDCIIIPSEVGWISGMIRVALRRQLYRGTIKVVSDGTDAVLYHFELDPDNQMSPLILQRLNSDQTCSC